MKNRIFNISLFLLLINLFSFLPTSVLAQNEAGVSGTPSTGVGSTGKPTVIDTKMVPPAPDIYSTTSFLGQTHYYSVTFRGNGEAVVSARMAFANLTNKPQSSFTLEFGNINPNDISVYQVIKDPVCIRYADMPSPLSSIRPANCVEYQEPDYFQTYWGQSQYSKADYELKGDTLTINLPKPVKAQGSGSIFVYYRANGYAKKDILGAYMYTFTSLKVNEKIQSLQIGISTDSDLILKDAQGTVNYRTEDAVQELRAMAPSAAGATKSVAFDNFYNQIGYGSIQKYATNLSPSETYKVNGKYADTRIKLYGTDLLKAGGMLIAAILVIVFVGILIARFLKSKTGKAGVHPLILVLGLSFASAAASSFLTVLFTYLVNLFSRNVTYMMAGSLSVLLLLSLLIISLGAYVVLLFGPAIYVGIKRGPWWGLATVGMTILWIILFTVVIFGGLYFFIGSRPNQIITPMMGGAVEKATSLPTRGISY